MVRADVAGFPTAEEILAILPKVKIVAEDGIPLETAWHRKCINLLIEVIEWARRGRTDFYVGGNQFIYYDEKGARNRNFRGPDFFYVEEVAHDPPRECWVVWLEGGRYPDVLIELSSESTRDLDLTERKDVYERTFRTYEYFVYDPDSRQVSGWRLSGQRYEPIQPNARGRVWSHKLGAWVGTWSGKYQGQEGVWLRFFDMEGNLLPTGEEAQAAAKEAAQERAEAEAAAKQAERQRAEAAERRAEAEAAAKEVERQRADALAAELAQLRSQLAAREQQPPTDPRPAQ